MTSPARRPLRARRGAPVAGSPGLAARLALAPALAALLSACEPPPAPPARPAPPSYKVPSMRWLPPGSDVVYAYRTENLIDKTSGVMSLRLRNGTDDSVELHTGQRSELLRYQPTGILRERTGALLLRTPPEVGLRWPSGPNASTSVARAGVRVVCEAGTFEGCVDVVEERSAPVHGAITTTFCPDVGIVRIETLADEPPIHERVELRSFGKPIDLSAP